jgi:AcrR family transcriptional regulator
MTQMLEIERLRQIRDELVGRSWHELGIEDIARAAGLSRMTLHRRGIDKDLIGRAMVELMASEFQIAALLALTSSAPAPQRLELALRSFCEVSERFLGLMDDLGDGVAQVFHERGEDDEIRTHPWFTDALRRILEDGVRDGTLKDGQDVDEVATLLFNSVIWTYRHMRMGHLWTAEKASDRVVSLLVSSAAA